MFDFISNIGVLPTVSVVSSIVAGLFGLKYKKYLKLFKKASALIASISEALEPDKDGRIRITKEELARIIERAYQF